MKLLWKIQVGSCPHISLPAPGFINKKEEVLLVKTHNAGWVFPGGQVEVGENVIDAVKREIMEETGIDIEVGEVFCISSNTGKYPGYHGVKEIPTQDADFDTEYHEAVTTFPAPTPEQKGKVIDCVQKGYTMNDKVIRFAKVVVGE